MPKGYDFDIKRVIPRLVKVFKSRKGAATVGDLVVATGLPNLQVTDGLKVLMDEYHGAMKVTDTGEILYYFPHGMVNRANGARARLKRFFRRSVRLFGRILALLFKAWIVAMLIGYFIVFLVLAVMLAAALMAGDSKERGRRGGTRHAREIRDLVVHLVLYGALSRSSKNPKPNNGPRTYPLHKAVFYYVFGDGDPNVDYDRRETDAIINFIRRNKGILTVDEIALVTGKSYDESRQVMNRFLSEYEGEPDVTDEGTLYVRFPLLMRTTDTDPGENTDDFVARRLYTDDRISPLTRGIIVGINTFNLLFAVTVSLFSFVIAGDAGTNPVAFGLHRLSEAGVDIGLSATDIGVFLGVVPLVYSVLFFGIRWVRRHIEQLENDRIRQANFFRHILSRIFNRPAHVLPEQITPSNEAEKPKAWEEFRKRAIDEYAAEKGVEFIPSEDGSLIYRFPEVKRERDDLARFRERIDSAQYAVGATVFDSAVPL